MAFSATTLMRNQANVEIQPALSNTICRAVGDSHDQQRVGLAQIVHSDMTRGFVCTRVLATPLSLRALEKIRAFITHTFANLNVRVVGWNTMGHVVIEWCMGSADAAISASALATHPDDMGFLLESGTPAPPAAPRGAVVMESQMFRARRRALQHAVATPPPPPSAPSVVARTISAVAGLFRRVGLAAPAIPAPPPQSSPPPPPGPAPAAAGDAKEVAVSAKRKAAPDSEGTTAPDAARGRHRVSERWMRILDAADIMPRQRPLVRDVGTDLYNTLTTLVHAHQNDAVDEGAPRPDQWFEVRVRIHRREDTSAPSAEGRPAGPACTCFYLSCVLEGVNVTIPVTALEAMRDRCAALWQREGVAEFELRAGGLAVHVNPVSCAQHRDWAVGNSSLPIGSVVYHPPVPN